MKLKITKRLINTQINKENSMDTLVDILESIIELLSLPENNFVWSHWKDSDDAISEINSLVMLVKSGSLPERDSVSILFAPTSSLQEVRGL